MSEPLVISFCNRSRLYRETMLTLLESHGIQVDGLQEGTVPDDLAADQDLPDIVLFEIASLKTDPAGFQAWCRSPAKVIITADEFDRHYLQVALQYGADGYLTTDMSPQAFVAAIRLVAAGQPVFPSNLRDLLLNRQARRGAFAADGEKVIIGYPGLYPRDARILGLIMNGQSNKEIARALATSEEMVKLHIRNIMQVIKVRNRTQAALWAARSGLFDALGGAPANGGGTHDQAEERSATTHRPADPQHPYGGMG